MSHSGFSDGSLLRQRDDVAFPRRGPNFLPDSDVSQQQYDLWLRCLGSIAFELVGPEARQPGQPHQPGEHYQPQQRKRGQDGPA